MPSTVVKLCSSDARAWAKNQPVWLDAEGEVKRPVTASEQQAIGKALERTKKVTQSFRQVLPLLPPKRAQGPARPRTRTGPIERAEFAFEIGFIGQKRVVTVYRGDLRYATGREVLAARLLFDHGECVLHGLNGKCIGVLRDPFIQSRAPNQGKRVQWSRNPEDSRKAEEALVEQTRTQGVAPVKRAMPVARAAVKTKQNAFSPKNCPNDCRGFRSGSPWAHPKNAAPLTPNQHHPVCMHRGPWEKSQQASPTKELVLYDLEQSKVMRAALPAEVAEAEANFARTQVMMATVQGKPYAVLTVEQAEEAAAEARGDAPTRAVDATAPVRLVRPTNTTVPAAEEPEDEHELDTLSPPAGDEEPSELELEGASSDDIGHAGADEGDAELDLADADLDPAELSASEPGTSTESDRQSWPTLDDLTPNPERYRERAEVTAAQYLTRRPTNAAPTGT